MPSARILHLRFHDALMHSLTHSLTHPLAHRPHCSTTFDTTKKRTAPPGPKAKARLIRSCMIPNPTDMFSDTAHTGSCRHDLVPTPPSFLGGRSGTLLSAVEHQYLSCENRPPRGGRALSCVACATHLTSPDEFTSSLSTSATDCFRPLSLAAGYGSPCRLGHDLRRSIPGAIYARLCR